MEIIKKLKENTKLNKKYNDKILNILINNDLIVNKKNHLFGIQASINGYINYFNNEVDRYYENFKELLENKYDNEKSKNLYIKEKHQACLYLYKISNNIDRKVNTFGQNITLKFSKYIINKHIPPKNSIKW